MTLALPNRTQRTAVIGRTGSGKTQFGIWLLGEEIRGPWAGLPVVIFDFKGDKLIEEINAKEIDIRKPPPTKPGLYVVRPLPHEEDEVTKFLWGCWSNGNIGIYNDEGYMLGQRNPAFRALLTQGRSKNIPMIYLSQRPVYMDRFAFSEADCFAVFHLVDSRDIKTVQSMVSINLNHKLPKYNCIWYDVASDRGVVLSPVPSRDKIIENFPNTKRRVLGAI